MSRVGGVSAWETRRDEASQRLVLASVSRQLELKVFEAGLCGKLRLCLKKPASQAGAGTGAPCRGEGVEGSSTFVGFEPSFGLTARWKELSHRVRAAEDRSCGSRTLEMALYDSILDREEHNWKLRKESCSEDVAGRKKLWEARRAGTAELP